MRSATATPTCSTRPAGLAGAVRPLLRRAGHAARPLLRNHGRPAGARRQAGACCVATRGTCAAHRHRRNRLRRHGVAVWPARALRPCAGRNRIQHPRGSLSSPTPTPLSPAAPSGPILSRAISARATPPAIAALLLPILAWRPAGGRGAVPVQRHPARACPLRICVAADHRRLRYGDPHRLPPSFAVPDPHAGRRLACRRPRACAAVRRRRTRQSDLQLAQPTSRRRRQRHRDVSRNRAPGRRHAAPAASANADPVAAAGGAVPELAPGGRPCA